MFGQSELQSTTAFRLHVKPSPIIHIKKQQKIMNSNPLTSLEKTFMCYAIKPQNTYTETSHVAL